MAKKQSEYVKLFLSRFGTNVSKDNRDTVRGLTEVPEEEGIEDEMLKFLQENPEASLQDVMRCLFDVLGLDESKPLEIVDDDELDEDDW